MADDDKRTHLGFLQSAISRIASNAFLIKGWSVTLASALLSFAVKEGNPRLALVALVPIFIFWGLDGYFLGLERAFRRLYSDAIETLDTTEYAMDPKKLGFYGWLAPCCSPTVLWFHLALVCAALGIYQLIC